MQKEPLGSSVNTEGMENNYFLIGLISKFNNSFQAAADKLFSELSWKQVFFLNCAAMFKKPPTINDMAQLIGCSHQNAKQILLKLEKLGYAEICKDSEDKRKQRIVITDKANAFRERYNAASDEAMQKLFNGIDSKDLETTIKVITALDKNLENI